MHCFYGAKFGIIVFLTAFLMVQDYIKKNGELQFLWDFFKKKSRFSPLNFRKKSRFILVNLQKKSRFLFEKRLLLVIFAANKLDNYALQKICA